MEEFYIVHLTPKHKCVIHKTSDLEKAIEFVKEQNEGSTYLDGETVDKFLVNYELEDGLYIVIDDDNDLIKVYKLETTTSIGYIYNSQYKNRELVNEYELITKKY